MKKTIISLGILLLNTVCLCGCDSPSSPKPPPNNGNQTVETEVNVTKFKSLTSDHAMIQKAIDYAHQEQIPVVYVPAGKYMIDAVEPGTNTTKGILLRDNVHLKLDDKAILKAIPNSSPGSSVVTISDVANVKVSGGTIIGERDEHTGVDGEWGMGIKIFNSRNIEVKNIFIKDCWGDGIYVGGYLKPSMNILVDSVKCENNRRQGISVAYCDGMVIKNSAFNRTSGTSPEAGIDLEPNKGETVDNVTISNCSFTSNRGNGLIVTGRSGFVSNVKLNTLHFENNGVTALRINGTDYFIVEGKKNVNNVEVYNINIPCDRRQRIGVSVNQAANINVDSVVISNPKFESTDFTILESAHITNSSDVNFSKIYINDFLKIGINILNSTNVKLLSSSFSTSVLEAQSGIKLSNSTLVELSSLNISGGVCGISANAVNDFVINSVNLDKHSENSIRIEDSSHGEVKNSTCQNFGNESFLFSNINGYSIIKNTILNNSITTSTISSYMFFLNNSRNNIISDNNISLGTANIKPLYGIYLSTLTENNKFTNNRIDENSYSQAAIKDEGLNNQY